MRATGFLVTSRAGRHGCTPSAGSTFDQNTHVPGEPLHQLEVDDVAVRPALTHLHGVPRAAVRYLKTLHGMFAGDWRLAVMAYNAGEYRVFGALRKSGQVARSADPEKLTSLSAISRAYVRKLHALSCLFDQADDECIPHHEGSPCIGHAFGPIEREAVEQFQLAWGKAAISAVLGPDQVLEPRRRRTSDA